jgi:hypothetical protein
MDGMVKRVRFPVMYSYVGAPRMGLPGLYHSYARGLHL